MMGGTARLQPSSPTHRASVGRTALFAEEEGHSESQQLYVCNLPESFDDMYLKALFKAYGSIKWAKVSVSHVDDGHSICGYLKFEKAASAKAAKESMHGMEVCGLHSCKEISVEIMGQSADAAAQKLLSRCNLLWHWNVLPPCICAVPCG